jgi:GNAT superfamily N-acetyltransferase
MSAMDSTSPLIVRRATASDASDVWPLALEFATSYTPVRPVFERTFAALVDAPGTLLLVARRADAVVGYLLASTHLTFLANGPVVWVEEVMVDSDHRRHGIGRALMDEVERWAAELDAAYVSLASRRAGDFYRELGYDDSATFFKKAR